MKTFEKILDSILFGLFLIFSFFTLLGVVLLVLLPFGVLMLPFYLLVTYIDFRKLGSLVFRKFKSLFLSMIYWIVEFVTNFFRLGLRVLILGLFVVLILFLQQKFTIDQKTIPSLVDKLIDSAGILSAIILAFVTVRVVRISQEKKERKNRINQLSKKITVYRKALYFISSVCYRHDDEIDGCRKKYPQLSQALLEAGRRVDAEKIKGIDVVYEYTGDTRLPNKPKFEFYLALDQIVDTEYPYLHDWVFDPISKFNYSLEQIRNYYYATSKIWSLLDRTPDLVWVCDDPKFKNDYWLNLGKKHYFKLTEGKEALNRENFSDLASELNSTTLPELFELTELNLRGLPRRLIIILITLVFLLLFGVVFPLMILAFELGIWSYSLALLCFTLSIVSLISLIFDLIVLVQEEIHV